jgi:hypothetical protein
MQLLIERTDDGWICHGDGDAAMAAAERERERDRLTANQSAVLQLMCNRQRVGLETTAQIVAEELDATERDARKYLGALVRKGLVVKQPGAAPPSGGRPASVFSTVPDACGDCSPDPMPEPPAPDPTDASEPEQLSL